MPRAPVQVSPTGVRGYNNPLLCVPCDARRRAGDRYLMRLDGTCEHYRTCPSAGHQHEGIEWVILLDSDGHAHCDHSHCDGVWFDSNACTVDDEGFIWYAPDGAPYIIDTPSADGTQILMYHRNAKDRALWRLVAFETVFKQHERPFYQTSPSVKPEEEGGLTIKKEDSPVNHPGATVISEGSTDNKSFIKGEGMDRRA